MRLIYPVLVQVFWSLVVAGMMGRSRVGALKARDVKMGDIALGNDAWPAKVKAIGNNFSNQFETPVLFYVLCAAGIYVGSNGWLLAGLAWVYVVTRVAHTLVHTGSNTVRLRFNIFAAGLLTISAMLIVVAVKALRG